MTQTTEPTTAKIRRFSHLAAGWHYGEGVPISAAVVSVALAVDGMLRRSGYDQTDAFPGTDGEIQVCGYRGGRCITLEISDEEYQEQTP